MDVWTYYIYSLDRDVFRLQIGEQLRTIIHYENLGNRHSPTGSPLYLPLASHINTTIHHNINNGRTRASAAILYFLGIRHE